MKKIKTQKRKAVKRLTLRQCYAIEVASRMVDTSPLPDFEESESGRNARKEEVLSRVEDALLLAHNLVEYVRANV